MASKKLIHPDWWKSFFDATYVRRYRVRLTTERTAREVNFLIKNIPLKKNYRILDIACGDGRHAVGLAKKGFLLTGLDYSSFMLRRARAKAGEARAQKRITFVRGDMRAMPFHQEFDAAYNLFTSFGYFEHASDDLKALKNIAKSLKVGGKFMIDFNNYIRSGAYFMRHGIRAKGSATYICREDEKVSGDHSLYHYNPKNKTLVVEVFYKKKRYVWSTRAYVLADIKKMLARAGLHVRGTWGDFRGNEYQKTKSPRLILLAEKQPR